MRREKNTHEASQAGASEQEPARGGGNQSAAGRVIQHVLDEPSRSKPATAVEIAKLEQALDGLVKVGGSAAPADAELVRAELRKLPIDALLLLKAQGTKVVVCRNSIGDYMPELRKRTAPLGWPAGKTYGDLPGMSFPLTNEVVIAVSASGAGDLHIPHKGEGHGSRNLLFHETTHSIDLGKAGGDRESPSSTPAFDAAFRADWDALPSYEKTDRRECYAESSARYYSGDPESKQRYPHLHAYFAAHPLGSRQT